MKRLLLTCALPYANGPIHLGHLVEHIQADIWVRYWRLRGREVLFFCADDTHGTPIMMRAWSEGTTSEELIGRVWHEHRRDFAAFGVEYDHYYTTHSEENRQLSIEIYQGLRANGHIIERDIEQAYCPKDEMFLPDRYIRGKCPNCGALAQYGDSCEVCTHTHSPGDLIDPYCGRCGAIPQWRGSTHLFFRLADFEGRLREWLSTGRIQAEVANKLEEFFTAGLQDWDISRDAPYFGFEIPDYPGKYFYVWLDAPVGYMATTLAWCRQHGADFDSFWRRDDVEVIHVIGKDIVYFHALFWPATLMGSGFRTPTELAVHGFLTVNGEKMSKTRGTFINASTYCDHLDPQYLRYYYATKLNPYVEDLDLNYEDFIQRVNSDLVHKLANIPSRTLAILHKSHGGRLGKLDAGGKELLERVRARREEVGALFQRRDFAQATRVLAELAGEINSYLQDREPWKVAKEDPSLAASICTAGLNAFRVVATLLQPILPRFAELTARVFHLEEFTWAGMEDDVEEAQVEPYERLVDRVDPSRIEALIAASSENLKATPPPPAVIPPAISLDALIDCELQALRVKSVEPTFSGKPGYLCLRLENREGTERTVVARIGDPHDFQHLDGQVLAVLANLIPKTIQGSSSQGMILAVDLKGQPVPLWLQASSV